MRSIDEEESTKSRELDEIEEQMGHWQRYLRECSRGDHIIVALIPLFSLPSTDFVANSYGCARIIVDSHYCHFYHCTHYCCICYHCNY